MDDLDSYSDQDVLDLIRRTDALPRPLPAESAHALSLAFREVRRRGLAMDPGVLARWIGVIRRGHDQPGLDAIGASVYNDSPAVRESLRTALAPGPRPKPRLTQYALVAGTLVRSRDADSLARAADLLDEPERRRRILAAQALARLHDAASADRIVDLLADTRTSTEYGHVTVALEVLGVRSVAPRLQTLLPRASDHEARWLQRAITRLTGHNPLPPELDWRTDPKRYRAESLRTWMRLDLTQPPQPYARCTLVDDRRADVAVGNGRDVFAVLPDDPEWEAGWPEWNYSWCHDRTRVYGVGGSCSTCDVLLERVGWAPDSAVRLAQAVRDQVSDVRVLDDPLLAALEPVLTALATGWYQVRLVDLPLVASTWRGTWFGRGAMAGEVEQADSPDPEGLVWQLPYGTARETAGETGTVPETAGTVPVASEADAGEPRRFVVAPTQPTAALDPRTVADYVQRITDGQRPAAIVAACPAQRQAYDSDVPHRSLTGFVLDGHHKVAAYIAAGRPVRAILICARDSRQPMYTDDPLAIVDELAVCAVPPPLA